MRDLPVPVRTPIHDMPTLPGWCRERVVLIGDAAHAMSPAGGQGASLALEDAMLLGQLVAERARPLEQSFSRFEQIRRSRAEAMVKQGYENDVWAISRTPARQSQIE